MKTIVVKKILDTKIYIPAPKMRVNFFRPGGFHSPRIRPYNRRDGKSVKD